MAITVENVQVVVRADTSKFSTNMNAAIKKIAELQAKVAELAKAMNSLGITNLEKVADSVKKATTTATTAAAKAKAKIPQYGEVIDNTGNDSGRNSSWSPVASDSGGYTPFGGSGNVLSNINGLNGAANASLIVQARMAQAQDILKDITDINKGFSNYYTSGGLLKSIENVTGVTHEVGESARDAARAFQDLFALSDGGFGESLARMNAAEAKTAKLNGGFNSNLYRAQHTDMSEYSQFFANEGTDFSQFYSSGAFLKTLESVVGITSQSGESAQEAATAFQELFDTVDGGATVAKAALTGVEQKTAKLNKAYDEGSTEVTKFGDATKEASKKAGGFGSSIMRIAKYMAIRYALRALCSAIKEGFTNLYEWSKAQKSVEGQQFANNVNELKVAFANLKNQFAGMAAPLLNAITPAIKTVISWFTKLLEVASMVTAVITGSGKYYKATATSIDDIGESASSAGSAAKNAIASFDELEVIGNSGSGGSGSSGTDYDAMFDLVDVSGDLVSAFDDSSTAFGKLSSAFGDLKASIEDLFSNKSLTDIIATLLDGAISSALITLADAIEAISGFVDMLSGIFSGDWDKAADGLGKFVGNILLIPVDTIGVLLDTIDELTGTDMAGWWNTNVVPIFEAIPEMDWGNIFSSAISDIGSVGTAISEIPSKVAEWWSNIDWAETSRAAGAWLGNAIKDCGEFITVDIPNFFTKIVDWFKGIDWAEVAATILEGIADALTAISDFSKSVGEFCSNLWEGIKEGIKNAIGAIADIGEWIKTNIVEPFVEGFKSAFDINSPSKVMSDASENVGNGILEGILKPFADIGTWLQTNIVDPISNWFSEHSLNIWSWVTGGTGTTSKVNLTVNASGTALDAKKQKIITAVSEAWGTFTDKAATLTSEVSEKVNGVASSIKEELEGFVTAGWNTIKTKTANFTANLKGTSSKVFTTVSDAWGKITDKAADLVATVKEDAGDGYTSIKAHVEDLVTAGWNTLKSTTANLTVNLKGTKIASFTSVSSAWETIKDKAADLVATVSENAGEGYTSIKAHISDLVDAGWDKLKTYSATLTATLKGTKSTIIESVGNAWANVETKTAELTATVKDYAQDKLSSLSSGWNSLLNGTKSVTLSVSGTLSSAASAISDLVSAWNGMVTTKFLTINATLKSTAIAAWNKMATWIHNAFPSVTIPQLANGGYVGEGQLFLARETGPELVGTIGGHTAVANNDQIVAGVSNGVAKANAETNSILLQQNQLLMELLAKDLVISPSAALGAVNAKSAILYGRV